MMQAILPEFVDYPQHLHALQQVYGRDTVAPLGNQAANGEHKLHAYSTGRPQSTRQKLMRLHRHSISEAPRAVHDIEWDLYILRLG